MRVTASFVRRLCAALLAWCLSGPQRARRCSHVLAAAAVAATLTGPIFWLNREWVWNYYYLGHYVGPESAIRNQNFGLWKSTEFVWGRLATQRSRSARP